MQEELGQHGWKEFLSNRTKILNEFDYALSLNSNRPVRTSHGETVESSIRNWLSLFLPKKYGITSGYIISSSFSEEKILHYDIIIYDLLEAPTLWTDGNFDKSDQGFSRAIPARNVICVFEVKSRLTRESIKSGVKKLEELNIYKDDLHKNFFCGSFFVDLKESNVRDIAIIDELLEGKDKLYNYFGGVILRYELDHKITGYYNYGPTITKTEEINDNQLLAKKFEDWDIYFNAENQLVAKGGSTLQIIKYAKDKFGFSIGYHIFRQNQLESVRLSWSVSNFANFSIDLINKLAGYPISLNNRQHSFGKVFDKINRKEPSNQAVQNSPEDPFIEINLTSSNFKKLSDDEYEIILEIEYRNLSNKNLTFTSDNFSSQNDLPSFKTGSLTANLKLQLQEGVFIKNFNEINEVFSFNVIYYITENIQNKDYTIIKKQLVIEKGNIKLQ